MSEGVTGLEDASGQFPGQRDRVYSLREVRCRVMDRRALSGIVVAARSVKRRFFG